MIMDVEEIKKLLRITATTYDQEIQDLIPIVQRDLVDYLNNSFPDKQTTYLASSIELNARSGTDAPTISDTEGQFEIEGFAVGMDIALENTYRNVGIYTLSGVSSDTLILSVTDTLMDEESTAEYGGRSIRITRIYWPNALKTYFAEMVWEKISRTRERGITNKSLGPSAVTYAETGYGGYSSDLLAGLKKWKLQRMM